MPDRRGRGILSGPIDDFGRIQAPREVEAVGGLVVTHMASRFTGTVCGIDEGGVVLRSRNTGLERHFPLRGGDFVVGGSRATLVRPRSETGTSRKPALVRTASGSISTGPSRARPARASRLFVEGLHDAELVEKVWGDDLRVDAIAVELLEGIDHLEHAIEQFEPGPDARLGILVDHLVPGSKESRIAARLAQPHVLIEGTPYVDVWQAIRPSVLGLSEWPSVSKDVPWKQGICDAFGEPSPGRLWKRLLGQVRTYADLEPALVGAVESLIDFVTEAA
ncbi:MAG: DUF3097 family protein [Acidimicrobiales bacterium]|nr:DUF3097 family protein [Acidimicrobiales bacterium]